jgi:dTDP-4-dehydrorhamnose reductase
MNILVSGANGQLGKELMQSIPSGYNVTGVGREELDISNLDMVLDVVNHISPDIIINAAAYTAVDKAESEPDKAYAINAQGAANLAEVAAAENCRLIHISTDFIFDGEQLRPYHPDSKPNPRSVYGASKWKGEQLIAATSGLSYTIIRTSWVYSVHGNNFVKTILRLLKEKEKLGIIVDQIGSPTWTYGLARAVWSITGKSNVPALLHWSDEGVASWYDFTVAIQEEALDIGIISRAIPIDAIPSTDYPLPAQRPNFSVLEKSDTWKLLGFRAKHWRQSLRKMLLEIKDLENE